MWSSEDNGECSKLMKKVGEAELQNRVKSLEQQLREAKKALQQMGVEEQVDSNGNITIVPPSKRGYLFKWQDRSIGWGGTKWALRFVTLEAGKISYYRGHTEVSPRYVLTLRGCAVRDEGYKRNRRYSLKKYSNGTEPPIDETNAYFHVFSIYQRHDSYDDRFDDSSDRTPPEVVPLLRFSTPSLAEKTQWIKLISEACEYCETDEFLAEETRARVEAEKRRLQEQEMSKAMPEATRGTLPPLYFAPVAPQPMKRVPSGHVHRRLFRTTSGNLDAEKVESRSIKGYPPSKPMHREAAPSPLSSEGPVQSYRGFFNLAMILLVVSNVRVVYETIRLEGFFLARLPLMPRLARNPWDDSPFFAAFLLFQVFIIITYLIERLLSKRRLPETFGMLLHYANAHFCIVVSIAIVWYFIESPAIGSIVLMHGTITWMKLISYIHANQDYRLTKDVDTYMATLALVEDLDPADVKTHYPRYVIVGPSIVATSINLSNSYLSISFVAPVRNITLKNMYYFWFAPTLTYQIAFPRSPRVRPWKVVGIVLRLFFAATLLVFDVAQVISPNLANLVRDLEETGGVYTPTMLAHYGMKLSVANTYSWLLIFYMYFHLYLNLMAELLRFGDRVFYKDWWNSSEVSAYWRLWNMPVHYWLVRHVYFPCVRLGFPKGAATFVVFFLSAIMHEVLISVPFHMVRPWSFIGMIMQIPLVAITRFLWKRFRGSSVGNVIFWLSFCVVGQPMAILLYTIDYQYRKLNVETTGETAAVQLSRLPFKFWDQIFESGEF